MGQQRKKLYLRAAEEDDMMLLYRWVNDPIVRQSAFQSKFISLEEHTAWVFETLQNPDINIFILMNGNDAVGQVRVNIESGEQLIDYSVDREKRGKGYGKTLLRLLEEVCCREKPLVGRVKFNNTVSQRIFESLGYEGILEKDCYTYRKYL